jgi:hypothetical protein
MPPADGRLLPQDVAVELSAPIEWVEESRWLLPHHQRVSDMSWFVAVEDLHIWESAWELAKTRGVAA